MTENSVSEGASVKTVLGSLLPEQLAITSMHEHILWLSPGWQFSPEAPELFSRDEVFEQIKKDLLDYKAAGGQTIVDCTGIGLGRDVEFSADLSRATGVNIICSTGFWAEHKILPYFALKDLDYHVDLYVRELTEGMGTTQVKAGVIKVGNGRQGITPVEEMTYRAAARASRKTGAAIITHGINFALQHFNILLSEGADPGRIVISHCDAAYNLNLARDIEIAKKGAYVAYDHIGIEPKDSQSLYAMGDEKRVELCKAFIEAGFANHLVISCDTDGYAIHESRGTQPQTYAHLLRNFVPKLKDAGISEETIHLILEETPKRILPF